MNASAMPPHTLPLLQVVPPGGGGVHDFACALQAGWAAAGQPSDLLGWDPVHEPDALARRCLALGWTRSAPGVVLLHFSGYGYHPRGLCRALLQQIARLQQLGIVRLATVFHELFASGPPWRSAFWLGSLQAGLARQLARRSDALATNTAHHAAWLSAQRPDGPALQLAPVFSNIDPPAVVASFTQRSHGLVLFGSPSTRTRALQRLAGREAVLQALGVKHLTEIGPGGPTPAARAWAGPQRVHLGALDAAAVSQQLLQHRWALIDYPAQHLGKSGVFAAYAAHGCLVLNTAKDTQDADGLRAGLHYLPLDATRQAHDPASMTHALQAWYLPHDRGAQTRALHAWLLRLHAMAPWSEGRPVRTMPRHGHG
jgi:hypothetical protein